MKNEFVKEVDIRRIGIQKTHYTLKPTDEEKNALAKRFGIVSLNSLVAETDVWMSDKNEYEVQGIFTAGLRQICGVTLEEFDDTVSGEFDELFSTEHVSNENTEILAGVEIPTEIKGGIIDIGEVVAEALALAIPVFPRKPDAVFEYKSENSEDKNPFSILKKLKK